MADCRDRLFGVIKIIDQIDGIIVHPQDIGVHLAAGKQQGIEVFGGNFVKCGIDADAIDTVVILPDNDRAGIDAGEDCLKACVFQCLFRVHQFGVFKAISCKDQDALGHGGSPGERVACARRTGRALTIDRDSGCSPAFGLCSFV